MNKTDFIKELSKQLNYPKEKVIKINEILENNFLIGKKNKNKIIESLTDKLKVSTDEANKIYNLTTKILANEIKEKLIHPFKNQD